MSPPGYTETRGSGRRGLDRGPDPDLVQEPIERRVGSGSFVRSPAAPEVAARQLGLLIPGLGTTEVFEAICGELARREEVNVRWTSGSARPDPALPLRSLTLSAGLVGCESCGAAPGRSEG